MREILISAILLILTSLSAQSEILDLSSEYEVVGFETTQDSVVDSSECFMSQIVTVDVNERRLNVTGESTQLVEYSLLYIELTDSTADYQLPHEVGWRL